MNDQESEYEVLIIGGGIVGTALLYALSRYTDNINISLIEKHLCESMPVGR